MSFTRFLCVVHPASLVFGSGQTENSGMVWKPGVESPTGEGRGME